MAGQFMSLNAWHSSSKTTKKHRNVQVRYCTSSQQGNHQGQHAPEGKTYACAIRQLATEIFGRRCCYRRASTVIIRDHYSTLDTIVCSQFASQFQVQIARTSNLNTHDSLIARLFE